MKIFTILILLLSLVSCGKPKKKEVAEDPNNGIWFKNYTTTAVKDYAPVFLTFDTTRSSIILRVRFDYTTKDVYTHARVVTVDKRWTLSINNHRIIDCTGPDRYGFNNCRVEFNGVPAGTYLLEY